MNNDYRDRTKYSHMDHNKPTLPNGRPRGGGTLRLLDLVCWLPACAISGVAVAYAAFVAGTYHMPLILFPLLVGAGLGAVLVTMMRVGQIGNRITIVAGLLLAVAVVVPAQHYLSYLSKHQALTGQEQENIDRARELFPDMKGTAISTVPDTFPKFMQHAASEGRPLFGKVVAYDEYAWLSWFFDGLLVLAAAGGIVLLAMRQPYCRNCRSWYRTIRNGRIDGQTALRLAEIAGVDIPRKPISARYRMLNCNGGCGPTELDLSWEDAEQEETAPAAWIDPQCRDRLMRILDSAAETGGKEGGGMKDEG